MPPPDYPIIKPSSNSPNSTNPNPSGMQSNDTARKLDSTRLPVNVSQQAESSVSLWTTSFRPTIKLLIRIHGTTASQQAVQHASSVSKVLLTEWPHPIPNTGRSWQKYPSCMFRRPKTRKSWDSSLSCAIVQD